MKFAALALTFLLAVGSHGDVLIGDHVKTELPKVKEVASRIVGALTGTEYEEQIPEINARLDLVFDTITGFLDSDDMKRYQGTFKKEVTDKWYDSELRTTLLARYGDYSKLFNKFYNDNEAAFSTLKADILATISKNNHETGRVLSDALASAAVAVKSNLESLRAYATPYTQEYTEHVRTAMTQARESGLSETIQTKLSVIKDKIVEIQTAILDAFNKQ